MQLAHCVMIPWPWDVREVQHATRTCFTVPEPISWHPHSTIHNVAVGVVKHWIARSRSVALASAVGAIRAFLPESLGAGLAPNHSIRLRPTNRDTYACRPESAACPCCPTALEGIVAVFAQQSLASALWSWYPPRVSAGTLIWRRLWVVCANFSGGMRLFNGQCVATRRPGTPVAPSSANRHVKPTNEVSE
ncbi:MAG: hypothetical protein JWM63_4046 [Gammaproteobacteria bacterium]|nr:hypothetical protein [Gammaproteobacteria bacterium]